MYLLYMYLLYMYLLCICIYFICTVSEYKLKEEKKDFRIEDPEILRENEYQRRSDVKQRRAEANKQKRASEYKLKEENKLETLREKKRKHNSEYKRRSDVKQRRAEVNKQKSPVVKRTGKKKEIRRASTIK